MQNVMISQYHDRKYTKTSKIFQNQQLNSRTFKDDCHFQGLSRALNLQALNSSTFKDIQG